MVNTGRVEVGQVLNSSRSSAEHAISALGTGEAISDPSEFTAADLWLISTSDAAVEPAAQRLIEHGSPLNGSVVFHLSGRFGPEVLAEAEEAGAQTASVHPVRSMPELSTDSADFRGTICVAEGSRAALDALGPVFSAAGAGWREVAGLERGLYHAALAIVSNVTKGVIWKAENWLEAAGLDADSAAEVSHSLLAITTADVSRAGVRHTITGPVVRGDSSTVEAHLESLARIGEHDADVYRILARTVLDLANERGDLDDEVFRRFEILLGARHR